MSYKLRYPFYLVTSLLLTSRVPRTFRILRFPFKTVPEEERKGRDGVPGVVPRWVWGGPAIGSFPLRG